MKKVLVVTGSRAEYGLLRPVIAAIDAEPALDVSLVVTGMHLEPEFGLTADDIAKDGFPVAAKVAVTTTSDTLLGMAESLGNGIVNLARAFASAAPDLVLVLGDRSEILAAAVSAAYLNLPVGHIHGGDATSGGTIDDANRYAITKFAHVHFPATQQSADRILKLGEDAWRVHLTGSPALDAILNEPELPAEELTKSLDFDVNQPFVLLVQHAVTTQADEAAAQLRTTLEAVTGLDVPVVVIYPNSDAGGRRMIEVIKEYESRPRVRTFKSLSHPEYLGLLKRCRVMVGNSSSGLIEAPSFGTPVINVGIRQAGRERAANVIDVPHEADAIRRGVDRALNDAAFLAEVKKCENPYGDGTAGTQIARVLADLEITPALLQKRITY